MKKQNENERSRSRFNSQNYDGLIVRSDTKITAEVLEAGAGHVKVVGRYVCFALATATVD